MEIDILIEYSFKKELMKNIDPRQYTSDVLDDWVNIYFWSSQLSISTLLSSLSYSLIRLEALCHYQICNSQNVINDPVNH